MEETGRAIGPGRLDPKLDVVFWMLFGAEQNRALLVSLLNAVLNPSQPIVSAEVLHPEPERPAAADKAIALDVRVGLASGEQVDVEMQSRRHPALRERALFYWARLYSSQLRRGASYTELHRCAVILITDFMETTTPRFHSTFLARERHDGALFTDHFELHLVELPKLERAVDRNDEPSLAAWARFLRAAADDDLEALAMENPTFKQARDALDLLSADPLARARAEQRETALLAYEAGLAKAQRLAREKGLAEGRAEGKAEGRAEGKAEGFAEGESQGLAVGEAKGLAAGKVELVRYLLTVKFGELPLSVVERLTRASDSDLLRWSERVLSAQSLDGVFEA